MINATRNCEKPDWNIGYTTREHLCLDLDNTSFFKTENLVEMLMREHPELGHAVIMCSSKPSFFERLCYMPCQIPRNVVKRCNYHVVFNNFIDYEASCRIIETLAEIDVVNREYVRIRQMRNDMTLRVSKTVNMWHTKPKPKLLRFIINPYATKQDEGIKRYMTLFNCV